jgi:hypothetical protein
MRRPVSLAFSQKRRNHSSAATAVCRECRKRFLLSRRSNQHRHAGGAPHNGSRFCSPRCKQAAYRKRNAGRLETDTHATVTCRLEDVENVGEIGTKKTVLDPRIVPDKRYPNMYRLKLSDGSLSDMVSLTRAKDALAALDEGGAAVSRAPLAYVYDADDKSAGIFATPKEAAKALPGGES